MSERPMLSNISDKETFQNYYYLKSELVEFCRQNGLPTQGSKAELSDRVAYFLDTGLVLNNLKVKRKVDVNVNEITENTVIEQNIVCSELHRAFFKQKIGNGFSFNVTFQKWLKANAGKTYGEAIQAYYSIVAEKKHCKNTIDKQFEYNTYVRDFFADNQGRTLSEAIVCWRYKKGLPGHNRYQRSDLVALEKCD